LPFQTIETINESDLGAAPRETTRDDHKVHAIKVHRQGLTLDPRFDLDLNRDIATGPARPHGLVALRAHEHSKIPRVPSPPRCPSASMTSAGVEPCRRSSERPGVRGAGRMDPPSGLGYDLHGKDDRAAHRSIELAGAGSGRAAPGDPRRVRTGRG